MKEALLYEKLENNLVHCFLCAHQCHIPEGKFGFCGVKQNIKGSLYSQVYGRPIALHVDPIEKKPLYHFLPGSFSYSLATIGCNFHCGFCQNWEISQNNLKVGAEVENVPEVSAQEIVQEAIKNKCQSIAYTYTEPTIFFEYVLDIAKIAREKSLKNVFVTNGYMSKEAILMLKPYLDAANVDLKFFKGASYRKVCAGSLQPVLDSIRLMHDLGIWVEITTLIIPGENDSDEELTGIAEFIASIDKNIPWHISRFHPDYQFTEQEATPDKTLKKAQNIGENAGLKFIYLGNVFDWGNNTICPNCKKVLISRDVFEIRAFNLKADKCKYCAEKLAGIY